MTRPPICVVNIVSTSYAGSTWLNLLLGSHSQAFSVGELKSFRKHQRVACILDGEKCAFWRQFNPDSEDGPYVQLHNLTGRRFLIVNNSPRYLPGGSHPMIESKIIHLLRDGRAVSASMLRKGDERSYRKAVAKWLRNVRRNERLIARVRPGDVITQGYEKLAADTPGQVRRLCDFLGIDFEPSMLEYWNVDHHYLGGNRGTLFSLAQKRQQQLPDDPRLTGTGKAGPNWDLDHYKRTDAATFRDERWKRELSPWQLRLFSVLAGRVNRRYGYPAGADA